MTSRDEADAAAAAAAASVRLLQGDNLPLMRAMPNESFALIYADPPFNTGKQQRREHTRAINADAEPPTGAGEEGEATGGSHPRLGFGGRRYRTQHLGSLAFDDVFDDFLAFLEPRLVEIRRLLTPTGSFFLHLDAREVHYAKVLCDAVFGRAHFQNEIIWAYDYGSRSRHRWPAKHDTILWYTRDPRRYTFHYDAIDRIPYRAPRLAGPEKAARGKTPTDVWWQTIVSPTGREKTGYPTQKPLAILERIVRVHTSEGEAVLDPFAGSGTVGEAAARLGRLATLIDQSDEAMAIMRRRLAPWLGEGAAISAVAAGGASHRGD